MEHADWIQGFDAAQARFLMVTAGTPTAQWAGNLTAGHWWTTNLTPPPDASSIHGSSLASFLRGAVGARSGS